MPSTGRVHALQERYDALMSRLQTLESKAGITKEEQLAARQASLLARMSHLASTLGVEFDDVVAAPAASAPQQPAAEAADAGPRQLTVTPGASPTQQRLELELIEKGFSEFRFVRVPEDYYDHPLEHRQALLSAPSIHHLCKSMIMENTRLLPEAGHEDPLNPANWADPNNSRYYVVIVQYTTRQHSEKLRNFLHKLNAGRVSKQYFNLRLAPNEVSDTLSGYEHNAVTPIGSRATLPIIMSHKILELQPDFFFLGGGEVDLKVGFSAAEFVAKYGAFVADITY